MSLLQKILLGVAVVLAAVAVWRYVTCHSDVDPAGKDYEKRILALERDGDVSGLAAEIANPQIEASRMALSALGRIGTPEATGHMGKALTSEGRSQIRAAAAAAIGRTRACREMGSLLAAMVDDEDVNVRLSAAGAVHVIFGRKQQYEPEAPQDRRKANVEYIRSVWDADKEMIIKYHEMKLKQHR